MLTSEASISAPNCYLNSIFNYSLFNTRHKVFIAMPIVFSIDIQYMYT